MNVAIFTSIFILMKIEVNCYEMRVPLYSRRPLVITNRLPVTNLALLHHITALQKRCNVIHLKECPVHPIETTSSTAINDLYFQSDPQSFQDYTQSDYGRTVQIDPNRDRPIFRRMIDQRIHPNVKSLPLHGKLDDRLSQNDLHPSSTVNSKLNMKLDSLPTKMNQPVATKPPNILLSMHSSRDGWKDGNSKDVEVTEATTDQSQSTTTESLSHDVLVSEKFSRSLDIFERKFYETTFNKLLSISPAGRRENGMSFVQSGLFLQLALVALSTEVDPETRREIDAALGLDISDQERLDVINATLCSLPAASDELKFRWSTRLVLRSLHVSRRFRAAAAPALRLKMDSFNGTDTPKEMADALNHMVEVDSGGAIRNTFEEEEVSSEVRAVLVSVLYLRARWRSAPTLLNGTRAFRDAGGTRRAVRFIRLNDRMRYASLDHWDAEALEIFYSTPGLSLVLLVPRNSSLRRLAAAAAGASLAGITARMRPVRLAATLPLYTLRMTLLLPNKLQAMNMSRLVDAGDGSAGGLRLTLAVQRIMFWAEAGRNAYKDDGSEWDEPPERELVVDRPYIFYVRWKNKTIMNGNFVL